MTQDVLNWIALASLVVAVAGLVVTMTSVLFDVFGHAFGREEAFRRYAGRLIICAGVLSVGFTAGAWLSGAGVPPREWPDVRFWPAGLAAFVLIVLGVVVVVRTKPEPYVERLRYISKALSRRFGEPRQSTEPLVTVGVRFTRRRPASRELLRAKPKVMFLVGEAGSGRTLALRTALRRTHQHLTSTKMPRWTAVYVDLTEIETPITVEAVKAHVYTYVSAGDSDIDAALRNFPDERRKLKWIFLFDAFDEMAAANPGHRDEALASLRQFTDSRRAYHSVIVTQDEPDTLAGEDVLYVAPPTFAQQRELAASQGVGQASLKRLLSHLAERPELARRATNPLFLQLLAHHVRRARPEQLPGSTYELLEEAFGEWPESAGAFEVAETLAAHAIDPGMSTGTPDPAAVKTLIAAKVLRDHRNGPVFTNRLYEEYFAARWLVRRRAEIDLRELIVAPEWRVPIVLCLGPHTGELREPLIAAIREELDEQVSAAAWAIDDLAPYLTTPPDALSAPPARQADPWPDSLNNVLDVLTGLESGPRAFAELTGIIDRIVVSAFVHGSLNEHELALTLLPLASSEVGVWAVTRELWEYVPTVETAERLNDFPETFARLPGTVRLLVLYQALKSPKLVTLLVPRARLRVGDDVIGLAAILRATVRLAQVLALMGCFRFGANFLTDMNSQWLSAVLALGCGLFLYQSGGWQMRTVSGKAYITAVFPALMGVNLLAGAIGSVVMSAYFVVTSEIGDGVLALFNAAARSWPIALLVYIAWTGRFPHDVRDWLLPHLRPINDLVRQYVRDQDRDVLIHPIQHDLTQRILTEFLPRLLSGAVFAAFVLAVLGLFGKPVELPLVPPNLQDSARAWVTVGLAGLGAIVDQLVAARQRKIGRQRLHDRVTSGNLTGAELLAMLERAGRTDHGAQDEQMAQTRLLIQSLTMCPPESLRHATGMLRDLEAAFGQILYMAGSGSRSKIGPGTWESLEKCVPANLLSTLKRYDQHYPGQLARLATGHHRQIQHVIGKLPK
ncbi:NACHT domain-containing protein [Nonomuraea rubra]